MLGPQCCFIHLLRRFIHVDVLLNDFLQTLLCRSKNLAKLCGMRVKVRITMLFYSFTAGRDIFLFKSNGLRIVILSS